MKKDASLKGRFQIFFSWPLYLTALWVLLGIALYSRYKGALIYVIVFLAVYLVCAIILYRFGRRGMVDEMIRFASSYEKAEKDILDNFDLPYALLDVNGHFLWVNEAMRLLVGDAAMSGASLSEVFPSISEADMPRRTPKTEADTSFDGLQFRVVMQKVDPGAFEEKKGIFEIGEEEYLIGLSLFDTTKIHELLRKNEENKIVVGIVAIDNYDEAMQSIEEVRQSLLLALIDRKISKYFSQYGGLVRKYENERFIFIVRKTQYEAIRASKFSILEEVKDVKVGNEIAVTLSLGIGLNQGTFTKDAEAAQIAIDMALARGGDQVIIKDDEKVTFLGGRTESAEKYTRVKARVKAHALREIVSMKDQVVIMGHKITDVDALGAAIGIYRAAKTLGKPAHIVVDETSSAIQPFLAEFRKDKAYESDLFITAEDAIARTDANTVVVVVDTNRPSYTECRKLLGMTDAIFVLDHHRQGEEAIKNARLSYIEPYASSVCEMAAEILQYFDTEVKIRNIEADCMYAGIMVDTNNFVTRTGVRTFEAAAYLRRNGADVTRVRKMFRENLTDYRARAKAITDAELYMGCYAISVCPSEGLATPTIACAQAANELLNVIDVKASFVLTEYNDMVYCSARAIDEVNVQLIMERLGGGGHLNIAGMQIPDRSVEEVRQLLKDTIREMTEEGDI